MERRGEDRLYTTLVDEYHVGSIETEELTDILFQLSSLKNDHENWFEEYPMNELIEESKSPPPLQPSQLPSSPTSSSTYQHLTFTPSLQDQIMKNPSRRSFILTAYDDYNSKDVIVKASYDLPQLQTAHEHLNLMDNLVQSHPDHHNVVIRVYGPVLENITTYNNNPLHGIVLEKGMENLEKYLRSRVGYLNDNDKIGIGYKLMEIILLIHDSGIVWIDCKPSNVVHFLSPPDFRGIDFEHSLRVGEVIPLNHGCTVLYGAPEVVRYLSGGDNEVLLSSRSMDMWSVGVCLLEIVLDSDFVTILGLDRKDELERIYVEGDYGMLEEKISLVMSTRLRDEKYHKLRSILSHLLVIDPNVRYTCAQALDHVFFTHLRGTYTLEKMNMHQNIIGRLDDQGKQLEVIQEGVEDVRDGIEDVKLAIKVRVDGLLDEMRTSLPSLPVQDVIRYTEISQLVMECNDEGKMGEYEHELRRILERK